MIFKTTTGELGNTKLSINNGLKGLFSGDFFKKQSVLSDSDISALQAYNAEIERGVSPATAYYRTLREASDAANNMAHAAGNATVNLEQIPKVSKAGQVALKGLAIAGNMLAMWAISEAIGLVVTAIDNEINRVEYAQERLEEFNNTVSESKKELEDQQKWIEENGDRYEELARGVDNYGHNVSLTADEFSEYQSITKDIADMFPNMISGYNDQNDAIIKTKGNVDALTESYKENIKQAYASTLAKSSDTYDDYKTAIEDAETQKAGIEFLINSKSRDMWLGDNYGFTIRDGVYSREFQNVLSEELYEEITNYIKDNQSKFSSLDKDGNISLQFSFENLSAELQQKIRSALSVANSTIASETSKVKPVLEAFIYGEDGSSSGYGQLSEDGKQAIRNVISSLDDTFYSQFDSDTEMAAYFKSYFIEPLKDGLDDSDLAVKINTLFSIDKNDYSSYKEYVDAVLAKINELKTYKDANGNPIYSDDQIESLKKTFGVADIDSGGNTSGTSLINQTKEKYSKIKGAGEYIDTLKEDEIRVLYELKPDEGKSLESMKQAIDKMNQEAEQQTDKSAISSQKTFDEVWNSIGEGDDDAGKKAQEAKEKVLELAEAGKLTEKAFEKSSIADTFTQAGYSIEKATKKINDMVSSADQLASMKSGISSISSILGEKKENLSNKKTKNDGIGADTLSGMPDDVKAQADEYENFVKVLGNGASTMQQCREAANNLATAYVNSYNFLSKLTPETVGYYTSVLKQMGVENASEVVTNALAKQTYALRLEKLANSNATKEEITALQEEASQYGITSTALANYVIQKRIANNNALDTSKSISNLIKLAKQCGATSNVVIALQNLLKSTSELESLYQKDLTDFSSNAATDLQHAPDAVANEKSEQIGKASAKISASRKKLLKLIKDSTKIGASVKIKPTSPSNGSNGSKGSKGSKSNSSKSKELFNWIERKLERLNTKLDLVKAKYDNLPLSKKSSISLLKAENKNLDEQIRLLKQVQSVNDKSYSKYMSKANSVGLSSSLKKKVQNGQIKGSYNKLIKEYDEKTANKIQKYQDYYDKAQSAKKNSEDAKKSITDAKIQKYTNDKEYYDTLIAINQANQTKAMGLAKNDFVKSEISNTKKSYDNQIKIAKLQGKYNEAKQLQIEKENKITELQRQQVENIKTYYDNQVGILDNNEKDIQNKIDLLEAQGNIVSKSYYSSMSGVEKQKMVQRQAELNKLKGELAKVTKGSDDWYELQNDIQSVEDSINESQKAIVENTKAIGELIDAMYAEINAIAENLGSEFDFISGLARGETSDSDTGRLTDTGLLQLYTSGLSYSTYKATLAQSNQRLKEIQEANKQGKLLEGYTSLKSQKEAENEIAKTAQEQANSVKSYGDKIIEIVKDAISSMTEHLQDLIDARKEALDEEKDLRDYERSILEKTKNVSSLQKQYMAATGDTSEEGRLRMAQLRKSLDEAQQDLQDTEYDKYISDQQEMLDNLMSEYTDLMEKLQKNEDELLKQGIQAINANKVVMESILYKTADDYGYPTSQNLTSAVTALNNGKITADIVNGESNKDSVTEVIKAKCNEIITAYNKGASGVGANGGDDTRDNGGDNGGGGSGNNNGGASNVKTNTAITQNGNVLGGLTTYTGNTKTEKSSKTLIEQAVKNLTGMGTSSYWTTKKNPTSKTNQTIQSEKWNNGKILTEKGGYALYNDLITRGLLKGKKNTLNKKGKNTVKSKDMWHALNNVFTNAGFRTGGIAQLVKANGEDGLMMARNGEGFVSPENVQDIRDLMNITPNLTELVSNLAKIPDFKRVIPETTKNVSIDNITFDLPNVKNVSDFTDTIKKPEQQRAFAVAIGDAIAGKKLNINRY